MLRNAFENLAVESTANNHLNEVNTDIKDLLHAILVELKILNQHMNLAFENELEEVEIENGEF